MYDFFNDIRFNLILPDVKATSHKQAFQMIAEETAPLCGLPVEDLLERLLDHEKMASSGIGGGVAIPHMKFRRLHKPFTVFARLNRTVEFKAVDGEPVDLVCIVMSPMKDGPIHLRRLSRISRLLRDTELCASLREAQHETEMMNLIIGSEGFLQQAA